MFFNNYWCWFSKLYCWYWRRLKNNAL